MKLWQQQVLFLHSLITVHEVHIFIPFIYVMTHKIDHTIKSSPTSITVLKRDTHKPILINPAKDCLSRQTLYSSSYPRTMKANCTDILTEGTCIYHADDRKCNLKYVNSTIKYLITKKNYFFILILYFMTCSHHTILQGVLQHAYGAQKSHSYSP